MVEIIAGGYYLLWQTYQGMNECWNKCSITKRCRAADILLMRTSNQPGMIKYSVYSACVNATPWDKQEWTLFPTEWIVVRIREQTLCVTQHYSPPLIFGTLLVLLQAHNTCSLHRSRHKRTSSHGSWHHFALQDKQFILYLANIR